MFIQMLGWISLTTHNIPQQTFYKTLLLRPPQSQLRVVTFDLSFSQCFKDGKIISTFLQHSSFNVLWILEVSSRKYESQSTEPP